MASSISDLDTQIANLKKQRDVASLDGAKAVGSALIAGKVASLADDLEALLPQLSTDSLTFQTVQNIINVMRNGKRLVDGEIARIQGIVDAQQATAS